MDYFKYLNKFTDNVLAAVTLVVSGVVASAGLIMLIGKLLTLLPLPYREVAVYVLLLLPLVIWLLVFRAWARQQHAKAVGERITR